MCGKEACVVNDNGKIMEIVFDSVFYFSGLSDLFVIRRFRVRIILRRPVIVTEASCGGFLLASLSLNAGKPSRRQRRL